MSETSKYKNMGGGNSVNLGGFLPVGNSSWYLFPGRTEHGFLDICVHPPQSIVTSWNALQVAQSSVLVSHHFLHHSRVPGQFHCLLRERRVMRD